MSIRLIPDLDTEITARLDWLADVLAGWDPADLEPGEEFEDPTEAAAALAGADVLDRVLAAIRPGQTDPSVPAEARPDYAGRLLDTDGRLELVPLRLVDVAENDFTALQYLCDRIIDTRGPLNEAADQAAADAEHTFDPSVPGAGHARRVLGVMAVLGRADADTRTLTEALTGHDAATDFILSRPQAVAYRRWMAETNRLLGR